MSEYLEQIIKKDIKEFIKYYYNDAVKRFNGITKIIKEKLEELLEIEALEEAMDMLKKMPFKDKLPLEQLQELRELEKDIEKINTSWKIINERIESILFYQNININLITITIAYYVLLNIRDDPSKLEKLEDKHLLTINQMKILFENEVD